MFEQSKVIGYSCHMEKWLHPSLLLVQLIILL